MSKSPTIAPTEKTSLFTPRFVIALVLILAGIGWLVFYYVGPRGNPLAFPPVEGTPKAIAVAARISLILATQGLMQLTLFFALPFFFYASLSALDIGHGVFLLILSAMSLISELVLIRLFFSPLLRSRVCPAIDIRRPRSS